jgi:pilus assembly protein CpaC
MSLPGVAQNAPVLVPAAPAAMTAPSAPGSSMSRVAAEGKTLHVIVGHSIFLDTKTRLRRVYVADPSILNSVTLSPNQIIVTAMTPGVSSLTLLDETGQAQSYVISSDVDVDGLRVAMSEAMRGNGVSVNGSGGHVVLSGTVSTDAMADAAVKLAGLYSKEVANALTVTPGHPKQVRLQVRILEVDRSKAIQQGINLFNPGGNTSFLTATTTAQYPSTMAYAQSSSGGNVGGGTLTTSNPLNFMLYSAKLNLGATIQDLESKQILQILAEPTITTISGQTGNFLSGGEFPFPIVQPGGTGGTPVVTIQFRPYGVKLEFTPIVNEDGTIRLKVAPEVSALDYTNTITISGFTIPALSTRRASTEVELRSGQSFAISGLLDQRTTDILSHNPGPSSIPILGYLFKSKNINHSTTELVVVVTPTVVDPLTETADPSEPAIPIPTLDIDKYDKSLGRDANPNTRPTPITPDKAPVAPPVFPNKSQVQPMPTGTPIIGAPTRDNRTTSGDAVASIDLGKPASSGAVSGRTGLAVSSSTPSASAPVASVPHASVAVATAKASKGNLTNLSGSQGAGPKPITSSPVPPASPVHTTVEIMALSREADADAMVVELKRHGYNVAVNRSPQDALLHLDVGPFVDRADAENMRQRLILDGYNATLK